MTFEKSASLWCTFFYQHYLKTEVKHDVLVMRTYLPKYDRFQFVYYRVFVFRFFTTTLLSLLTE